MVTNDNFGKLIAGIFRPPSTSITTITLKNTGGVDRDVRVYGTDANIIWNLTKSAQVQIGKGTSTATRQNADIEIPFTSSPENVGKAVTQPQAYNSALGKITIATLISPTGGSGTITETAFTQAWQDQGSNSERYLIFRDLISGSSFLAGQAININYEVLV